MKISIKQYLLYSSIFAIFTEAFFFNFIIDWKLQYLILLINYILLFKVTKFTFEKNFVSILLFLIIHGIITYTIIWIPPNFMISQILGIAVVGFYYYNFVKLYKPIELITLYSKMAFWTAIIGYFLYFFEIRIGNIGDPRFYSYFKEPAHYCIVVLPACYFYLKTKKYFRFLVIFSTLILSTSSLGYVGCGLMFLLPNLTFKRIGYFLAITPVLAATFYYVYTEYPFFEMRVSETAENLKVINSGKFKNYTNLSTYILIANIYIAKNNIIEHPLGSGIGSHHFMYLNHYLKLMRPPEYLIIQGKQTDNSFDANSLFTRMSSEFGLFGIVFIIFLLTFATKTFQSDDLFFEQGVVIYFLLKLFRDGTYFPPELFFFAWVFYFSYKEYLQTKEIQNTSL